MQALIIASFLAVTGPGPAEHNVYDSTISGAAFSAKALNATQTFDAIRIAGYHQVMVQVAYTYNAATYVWMTCEESPDNSTWFKIPETWAAFHVLTSAQRIWRWQTDAASANFIFDVPIRFEYLRCSLGGTGATASDKATVTLYAHAE